MQAEDMAGCDNKGHTSMEQSPVEANSCSAKSADHTMQLPSISKGCFPPSTIQHATMATPHDMVPVLKFQKYYITRGHRH